MDVNGSKGPNSETVNNKYHDIRSFKVATFAGCAGVKLTGVGCVVEIGNSYKPIMSSDPDIVKYAPNNAAEKWGGLWNVSYWGGAKKACDEVGMQLPEYSVLENISKNKDKYPEIPQGGCYWSSTETNEFWAKVFDFGNCNENYLTPRKYTSANKVLCIR